MWDLFILDPMINVLLLIYDFLGNNFGIAIIIFTALIRVLTFPLTAKSLRSTQKMQELQQSKRWQDIQKKYKDNKQKLQEEQLKLYQEVGFNPLSGCLPTLIQFPIIIGLYQGIINVMAAGPVQLLKLSSHLYSIIPSSLIPLNSNFLWMDLGQPERVYLPFLPDIGIPTLTILVVITSYLSTKMTTPVSTDGQGSQMTQMMTLYMPLLMGYLAYTYASGLALYFVVSNLLGVIQNIAMGRTNFKDLFSFKRSPNKKT
jgi:YidC/Oxa1 family membrane protein insertase